MAPIYTPEVAARAVAYAADHPGRREYVVGAVTALMILGQKVAPGLLDRYLARSGFDAQMTDEKAEFRPGNLFAPLPGDPGADGPFAAEAHEDDIFTFFSRNRGPLALAAGAVAAIAVALHRD